MEELKAVIEDAYPHCKAVELVKMLDVVGYLDPHINDIVGHSVPHSFIFTRNEHGRVQLRQVQQSVYFIFKYICSSNQLKYKLLKQLLVNMAAFNQRYSLRKLKLFQTFHKIFGA